MAVLCPFTPLHLVDFKSSALGKSYESGISAFVGKVFSEFWYSTIGQELWGGNKDYLLDGQSFPAFFLLLCAHKPVRSGHSLRFKTESESSSFPLVI